MVNNVLTQETLGLTILDKLFLNIARGLLGFLFRYRIKAANKLFASTEHSYGEHYQECLQVFEGDQNKTPIIFIHGGGWIFGHMRSVAIGHGHFIDEGYPIFNINYPLAPEKPFPNALVSSLKSLLWIKERYPNIKSVHLMGDSAGGNLAAMVGLLISNPEEMKTYEQYIPGLKSEDFPEVKSIVSIYGIMDRGTMIGPTVVNSIMRLYAGDRCMEDTAPKDLRITPLDYKWQNVPPMYLAAAEKDPLTKSSKLANTYFKQTCKKLDFKTYPGVFHGFYEEPKKNESTKMKRDIVEFMESI